MISAELLDSVWEYAQQHLPEASWTRLGPRETGVKEGVDLPEDLGKMLKLTKVVFWYLG